MCRRPTSPGLESTGEGCELWLSLAPPGIILEHSLNHHDYQFVFKTEENIKDSCFIEL